MQPPKDCSFNNKTILHGNNSGIFYPKSIAGKNESCKNLGKDFTCNDGTMSPVDGSSINPASYKYATCINNPSFIEN